MITIHNDIRDEAIRTMLANIYYYLEMADKDEDIMLMYPIMINKDDNRWTKNLKQDLRKDLEELLQTDNFEFVSFDLYGQIDKTDIQARCIVRFTKDQYLDMIYERLIFIIRLIEEYNHRPKVNIKGIEQQYGLGTLDLRLTDINDLFNDNEY